MRMLFPPFLSGRAALGLLVVRLLVGAAFATHGWGKVQNEAGPTGWAGDSIPPALQAVAAYSELLGGAALIPGLLTPLAALALTGTMIGAVHFHVNQGHPFVGSGGPSWELAGAYLAASLLLLLAGPGRISIDAVLFGPRSTPAA